MATWVSTGAPSLKREDLARAFSLADQLNAHMGETGAPRATTELVLERHQAITLAFSAYEELRRAVSFLRWYEQDAQKIAPSVHKNALNKNPKRGETRGPADEPAKGPSLDDEKPAKADKQSEPKARGIEAAKEASKRAQDEDDVPPMGPDGKPLVPQDDPFAKG